MDTEPDAQDRQRGLVLAGLKVALADPEGEHRLYRAGKLDGLFPGKSGPPGDAAALALRLRLVEVCREERRGKASVEWVRLTPAGVEYAHRHDSPRGVLEDMRGLLRAAKSGLPLWLERLRGDFDDFLADAADRVARMEERLGHLERRVESALRRADADAPVMGESLRALVPWGLEALTYLDHRAQTGAAGECPLPELFAHLAAGDPEMTMTQFHEGVRRLALAGSVRLLPPEGDLAEPEYALIDRGRVFYYVGR